MVRVTKWATLEGNCLFENKCQQRVVSKFGSALDGHLPQFLALLADPSVYWIMVEHRDRFALFFVECLEAALAAQGRELVAVDPSELDDDLVRDMAEIQASFS